jgi:hypothetical protein
MARWQSCNVLQLGADKRQIWQFDGGSFRLNREQTRRNGEPLPAAIIRKSLWQKKLNIAWLPPEHVFIRVAQFPQSTPEETRSMVELQLEKLSPIPVTQTVWSMHVVPNSSGAMQTIILLFVSRNVVEEFLSKLEGEGYLADRLELPLLDQLQATHAKEDGAWIFPEAQGGKNTALVAWWYGGILQNVDLLTLPGESNRAASLKDQVMQMAWAGELEGWLTAPPRWHLVADDSLAAEWLKSLQEGLEQSVEVISPLPATEIAARTARRAADSGAQSTLLPPEFTGRYHQQFVDRLWMRGLGAVLGLYVVGLIIYFAALYMLGYRTNAVETQVKSLGGSYTNSLQLQAQYQILKDRQDLKFAALDCWEAVAETLPMGITLDSMNFSGTKKTLSLRGTASGDQVSAILDFSDKLRKVVVRGQPLFDTRKNDPPHVSVRPGGDVTWSYDLELKRTEQ